jgi:uridine kinase
MKPVNVPEYDFALHQRSSNFRHVEPADVVIMEGIMVLHMPEVRDLLHMKIYVDTDDDVRLARRCAWLPRRLPRLPDSDFTPV